MKTLLPKLAACAFLLAALGENARSQSPAIAEPAAQIAASPQQVLAGAIARVEAYETVSAKVRQRAEAFGEQFNGAGLYLQGTPRFRLFRLELQLKLGDETASSLDVCDGQFLWNQSELLGQTRLSRVDLDRVREVLVAHPEAAAAAPASLKLGGLPKVLRSLDQCFQFSAGQELQLGTLPVIAIAGGWRPERLALMLPDQKELLDKGLPPDLGKLPPQMPHEARVYLGKDDLFPYRIEYRRRPAPDAALQTMAALEFYEVQVNGPIDPRQFVLQPGARSVEDATDAFLQSRGWPLK